MNKLIPLIVCLAILLPVAAHAAEVKGLYRAEVPVSDQGAKERQDALSSALDEVLTKVTGYGGVAQRPEVADLIKDPARLVLQYHYQAAAPGASSQTLVVSFDEKAVNEALRRHGMPIWGEARPTTVMWLAIEDSGGQRLIGADDKAAIADVIRDRAKRRGLPLVLPLLDLQDQSQVQVADVWAGFRDSVAQASKRYQAQAVLIGRVYRDGGHWSARWLLNQGQNDDRWDASGPDVAAVLRDGIDGAADRLAARFAQTYRTTGVASSLNLRVDQVSSLAAYSRVIKYLRSLGGVKDVAVVSVEPNALTCRLALEVPERTVIQTITLGSTLTPEERTEPAGPSGESEPAGSAALGAEPSVRPGAYGGQPAPAVPAVSSGQPGSVAPPAPKREPAELTYRLVQ